MATIDDFGGSGQSLSSPKFGGPDGWAAAVRDAIRVLQQGLPNLEFEAVGLDPGEDPTIDVATVGGITTVTIGIPEGLQGAAADNPNYTWAVTTLSPGASATIDVTGTYPDLTVTLGIPTGATGATGPAPDSTVTKEELAQRARNDVLDPQLVAAGVSATPSKYGLTRVTDVVPPGTSHAILLTRTATGLDSVLASVFLTPSAGSGSALRLPVVAGESRSFGAMVRTDQPGMRAQINVQFQGTGGANVGSAVAGTYVSLPAHTWEKRALGPLTVPETAEWAMLSVNVTKTDGTNVTAGGKVWIGAVQSNVGALAEYGDGGTAGWLWSVAADESASFQFLPNDQDARDAVGPVGVSTLPLIDAVQWDGSFDGGSKAKYGARFVAWFFDQTSNEQALKTISLPPEWDSADLELWHGNAAGGSTLGTGLALSASADTVTATSHGKAAGTPVMLSSIVSATGVSASTLYYVVNPTTHTFQLATVPGGIVVDITNDGTATVTTTHGLGTVLGTGLALSASGNTITASGHGLATGAAVSLSSIVSATGVTAGIVYYVINPTPTTFQLATATGSTSVVDITADGTATVTALTSNVCVVLNYSVKEPGDNSTTVDIQTPNFGRPAAPKDAIALSDLGYGLVIPDDGIAHLRVLRFASLSSDTLPNDMAFLGVKLRRRQFGDRFDLSKMRIVRAASQNEYLPATGAWQDTGGSTYDSFEVLSATGRTFRGAVSIDANQAASDQPPTWTAAETQHAGIMTCFTNADNNYIAMFSVAANQFQLIKQVSNTETVLAKRNIVGHTLTLGTPYVLEIMADGAQVVASILTGAGELIDTVTVADTSFSLGGTGFHVFATQATLHWLEMS